MNKFSWMLFMTLIISLSIFTGCENSPVQNCIIANESFSDFDAMKEAVQGESVEAGKTVYASVELIESPKGSSYEAKWYINDELISTKMQEVVKDRHDIMVYELALDTLKEGTLKLEIAYRDTVVFSKEVKVQSKEG